MARQRHASGSGEFGSLGPLIGITGPERVRLRSGRSSIEHLAQRDAINDAAVHAEALRRLHWSITTSTQCV